MEKRWFIQHCQCERPANSFKETSEKMRSKTSWWKGRIIQVLPKETTLLGTEDIDESDESDDDLPLAAVGKT